MSQTTRTDALRARRQKLSDDIRNERKNPFIDEAHLKQMKRQRLALKDQLSQSG